jgi:hypothetical protein
MFPAAAALLALVVLQDTTDLRRAAREAQAGFERTRRGQLPISAGGRAQRCDERIGQFCYWYDARESVPPPEGPGTTAGREALLVELGAASQALPADPWLLGQRVRYLIEAGRAREAQRTAGACAEGSSWCAMLLGWAFHAGGDILEADSAFTRALAGMSLPARCEWIDLRLVLPSRQAGRWRSLPCAVRVEQAERWLELGRGLLAMPGNSVRTEMLARLVIVRVVDGTVTPYGMRFDGAHREMVLRYGWPVGWSRVPGRWATEEASIIGHDPSPAWGLLPDQLDPPAWQPNEDRPRSRFQPPGVGALRELEDVQVVRLPRGDGTLVIAAWQVTPTHPLNTPGATGVLSVQAAGSAPEVIARMEEGRSGVVAGEAPGGIELAGVEVLHPDGATWARHRTFWPDPLAASGPVLSDLLLFAPDSADGENLSDLLPRILRGTSVGRGARVGVYWEWRGLPAAADSVRTRLQVTRERGGAPVLGWLWPAGSAGRASGTATMVLDLARLGAGRYHLDLLMTAGGQEIRSRRALLVR